MESWNKFLHQKLPLNVAIFYCLLLYKALLFFKCFLASFLRIFCLDFECQIEACFGSFFFIYFYTFCDLIFIIYWHIFSIRNGVVNQRLRGTSNYTLHNLHEDILMWGTYKIAFEFNTKCFLIHLCSEVTLVFIATYSAQNVVWFSVHFSQKWTLFLGIFWGQDEG
jgi:hypothetical protein